MNLKISRKICRTRCQTLYTVRNFLKYSYKNFSHLKNISWKQHSKSIDFTDCKKCTVWKNISSNQLFSNLAGCMYKNVAFTKFLPKIVRVNFCKLVKPLDMGWWQLVLPLSCNFRRIIMRSQSVWWMLGQRLGFT